MLIIDYSEAEELRKTLGTYTAKHIVERKQLLHALSNVQTSHDIELLRDIVEFLVRKEYGEQNG